MAPIETTAKPKQSESSKVDDKPEITQNSSTDPSTVGHLQQTVSGSSKLTDPATEEMLQGATSSSSNEDGIPMVLFMPVPFAAERK